MSSVYGEIVTGTLVRTTVKDHLHLWMPAYLAEVCRQLNRPKVSPIMSYSQRVAFDTVADEHLPALVVVAPGLADEPVKQGTGRYNVNWAVGVGVVTKGKDADNAMELAEIYAAAIRSAMTQHPSLGNKTSGLAWLGERYDDGPGLGFPERQTRATCQLLFAVGWDSVVDSSQGPLEPPVDEDADPGEWPVIDPTRIFIDLHNEGVT